MATHLTLETQPVAVTVFPDRARVTRAGQVQLPAGAVRLEAGNLPMGLLPDSVRAAGTGTAEARLLGVSTRLEHFVQTPAEAARALEQRIEALEEADSAQVAQAGVLEKEQKHLDGLAAQSEVFARGLALRDRAPAAQAAIFDFVRERGQALQTQLLDIARQRRERARQLDQLRRQLREMQAARPRQRYSAVIELDVSAPGDFRLALTYVVTGAHWTPLYDLRVQEAGAALTYLAEVAQNTGEHWPGVTLTLSTARPSLSLAIPELDPWYIMPRPVMPQAKRGRVLSPAPMPVAMAAAAMPPPQAAPPDEAALFGLVADTAEVSEAGVALTYRLPGTADIPGDDEPRKVTVAQVNLMPAYTYVTAPKLEPVCYRRAELKNDSPYSLLPGRLQLFEQDNYLGATGLEFVAPGQTFELALGADDRMRVERNLTAREVDKAFIIGDRRRLRYAYTIEVENLRDAPQTVVVRDQLPVPRDEQIKVKLESADPKPSEHTELNQLEWSLNLAPGAKRAIRFDFNVEHPRQMDVIGLI